MYKIKKNFRVPTGHRLSKHKGDCKNFHGHNLKIEVTIQSEVLNDNDMVMDFKILSDFMKPILQTLDHCFLLNSKDEKYVKFAMSENLKLFTFVNVDPTAEIIAKSIYDYLVLKIGEQEHIKVRKVKVWENDDSSAVYEATEPARLG